MKKNKIKDQNQEFINSFFSCTDNAKKEVPEFLFQMLAIFSKTDPGYEDEYRKRCVMYFELLNSLVNGIEPVGKAA